MKMVLGLDPGRDKVGWAFVGREGELLRSGIFPSRERALFWRALRAWDQDLLDTWTLERPFEKRGVAMPDVFVVGKGTCGGALAADLRAQSFGGRVLCVDEKGTTLEVKNRAKYPKRKMRN